MPVHPSEEETASHVFDQVAKESSDSSTSDHPMHKDDGKFAVDAHKSKGPQIPDSKILTPILFLAC
jgi:hypothetical protein